MSKLKLQKEREKLTVWEETIKRFLMIGSHTKKYTTSFFKL